MGLESRSSYFLCSHFAFSWWEKTLASWWNFPELQKSKAKAVYFLKQRGMFEFGTDLNWNVQSPQKRWVKLCRVKVKKTCEDCYLLTLVVSNYYKIRKSFLIASVLAKEFKRLRVVDSEWFWFGQALFIYPIQLTLYQFPKRRDWRTSLNTFSSICRQ